MAGSTRPGGGDIGQIKALLQARIEALVAVLAPEGHRAGGYWMCRSKAHDAKVGGMFVWLKGGAIGAWKDAAGDAKGDVIGLIQYRLGLPAGQAGVGEALAWARDWLDFKTMSAPQVQRQVAAAAADGEARAAAAAAKAEKDARRALALFIEAKRRPFRGSPADRYLQTRGIDVAMLGRMPGVLGWLPQGAGGTRHAETGGDWPVLVAGLCGPDGKICAVHRTFLARDGAGKAPIEPQRKIWPAFAGCAIRLWRGETGLSIEDAARYGVRETLVVGEGVEDGLSAAVARPEFRTWAVGSLGNLAALVLPECIDEVIVLGDNDWGKPQARRQLDKGLAHLARQGATVRVARSHVGKDVNDALRGAA